MKTVTVSKITYERIKNNRGALVFNESGSTKNPNGTVSFPVDDFVFNSLMTVDRDPEQAIIILLNNVKGGQP